MEIAIDASGRLVIPKSIRQAAGIVAADRLEVRLTDDGAILLRPLVSDMHIEERHGVYVAVPDEPAPPLTPSEVEATRDRIREERQGSSGGHPDER